MSPNYYECAQGIISLTALARDDALVTYGMLQDVEWRQAKVAQKFDGLRINEIIALDQRNALAIHPDLVVDTTRSLLESISPSVVSAVRDQWDIDAPRWSSPQFTMYRKGHFIKVHRDSGDAFPKRLFTVVTYLTDSYDGGEISFPHIRKKFHPVAGTALVFPSDFVHEVKPLRSGVKCIFLFFLEVS